MVGSVTLADLVSEISLKILRKDTWNPNSDSRLLLVALGSCVDRMEMSSDLKMQLEHLEELFTVPTDLLHKISDHWVKELEKGLTVEGGDIVRSNPALSTVS